MKKSGLARHYDVLTPEERFRLLLQAFARDDRAEVDRLDRTCPSKTYTMSDAAYLDRRELIHTVTVAVCLDLTQYVAKLQVAAAFAYAARQLRDLVENRAGEVAYRAHRRGEAAQQRRCGPRCGTVEGLDPEEFEALVDDAFEAMSVVLEPLERIGNDLGAELARQAREIWDAFARFCRTELDLPAETIISALLPSMLERLESQREELDAAEPDQATVDEYERTLTAGWRRRLGLGSLPNADQPAKL